PVSSSSTMVPGATDNPQRASSRAAAEDCDGAKRKYSRLSCARMNWTDRSQKRHKPSKMTTACAFDGTRSFTTARPPGQWDGDARPAAADRTRPTRGRGPTPAPSDATAGRTDPAVGS